MKKSNKNCALLTLPFLLLFILPFTNFINYFFEIVVPQLLEYFKENAKDIPYSLLSEALINNKNYEKEVKEMIEKSNKVSEKYIEKNKTVGD